MVLEGLPENLLKLVSVEGMPEILPNLSKFLKSGSLFQATVLKSFPEKNKAIIKIAKLRVMVETRQPLTRGKSFTARVDKTSSHVTLKIVPANNSLNPKLSVVDDKTLISSKKLSDVTDQKTQPNKFIQNHNVRSPIPQPDKSFSPDLSVNQIKDMNLNSGQVIKAKVIRILSKTTAVVEFQDKLMTAHFRNVSPKPDISVKLSIQPYGKKFRLVTQEEITSRPVVVSNIKILITIKEPFGQMIQKLESLVTSPVLLKNLSTESDLVERFTKTLNLLKPEGWSQSQQILDSNRMKEQIDLSGINYEPKVKHVFEGKVPFQIPPNLNRDLKGQLLELLNIIKVRVEKKGTSLEQRRQFMGVIKTFSVAVDNVELQQLTNQFARQENQPIVIQIPDPFFVGKSVKLYLRQLDENKEERKNKEKEGVLLVFLLDLSALGNLRVDAQMNKEFVSIRINVENKDIAEFVDRNLNDFCSRLGDLGFEVQATCYVVSNIEDHFENELNQLLINDSERIVDLTT